MANLSVATLNCRGLGMAPHRRALFDYLRPRLLSSRDT